MQARSRLSERHGKSRHDKPLCWFRAIPFERKEGVVSLFAMTLGGVS